MDNKAWAEAVAKANKANADAKDRLLAHLNDIPEVPENANGITPEMMKQALKDTLGK